MPPSVVRPTAKTPPGVVPAAPAPPPVDVDALPGMGPRLKAKVVRRLGSEAALTEALRAGDLAHLAEVQGVGEARARAWIDAVQGRPATTSFLATPEAEALFARVREAIAARAVTKTGANPLRLIAPLVDPSARDKRLAWALAAAKETKPLPLETARRLLSRLSALPPASPAFEAHHAIFVDSEDDREALLAAGIDRWAPVHAAADIEAAQAVETGVYAYREGGAAIEEADHIVLAPFTTDPAILVPWAVTERFRRGRAGLEAASGLSELRGRQSAAREGLTLLAPLPASRGSIDAATAEAAAEEALGAALRDAETALERVTLTGADLVRAMRSDTPALLVTAYQKAAKAARAAFAAATGLDVDPFTDTLPPRVDADAVAAAVEEARRFGARARFDAAVRTAKALAKLEPAIAAEVAEHFDFDARQAIGSFVLEHELVAPRWGEGLRVEGGLHLGLFPHGERVDYRLGADAEGRPAADRLALLTGANSGGKSTLLESLAEIVAMAHAGLPVPARAATVPELDALHLFAERRGLGAGAFETFLRRLFPITMGDSRVLVLADELEAITELEAAAEIVAAFLEHLAGRGAFAVLATHMAPHILPALHTPVRVDGIEASGVDDKGRLIVDRSPRIGRAARSTPELILRRLASHGPVELRPVFAELAERVARRAGSLEKA